MVYKKIPKAIPSGMHKKGYETPDPYAAKNVLRELYSKGLFIIRGKKYSERVKRLVNFCIKKELKNKNYKPIFNKFVQDKDDGIQAVSVKQDRKTQVASGV